MDSPVHWALILPRPSSRPFGGGCVESLQNQQHQTEVEIAGQEQARVGSLPYDQTEQEKILRRVYYCSQADLTEDLPALTPSFVLLDQPPADMMGIADVLHQSDGSWEGNQWPSKDKPRAEGKQCVQIKSHSQKNPPKKTEKRLGEGNKKWCVCFFSGLGT